MKVQKITKDNFIDSFLNVDEMDILGISKNSKL
jgi:hypothetical protein